MPDMVAGDRPKRGGGVAVIELLSVFGKLCAFFDFKMYWSVREMIWREQMR